MPSGSGGGGGSVATTRTVLTNAQIKALPTTSVEVVPTPGAGLVRVPIALVLSLFGPTAYTNVAGVASGSYMVLADPADNFEYGGYFLETRLEAVFESWLSGLIYYHQGLPADTAANVIVPETLNPATAVHLFVNNAGAGNFTAGDATNTLTVTVAYLTLAV